MPDFTVDIGGLDALVKNLDRSSENIDTATKHLADLAPSELGPQDLDGACADFREDWKGGLGELRDAIEEIRGGLEGAKNAYADVENTIARNLDGMANSIGEAGSQ